MILAELGLGNASTGRPNVLIVNDLKKSSFFVKIVCTFDHLFAIGLG
jgi:hypothetical protein